MGFQLSEVTVVEHIEGDPCKFGLRLGEIGMNENRMEMRAKNENEKVRKEYHTTGYNQDEQFRSQVQRSTFVVNFWADMYATRREFNQI